ncbi:MAG TPA: polyhydroxyalkanoic acid system family protein [Candidatus Paceibacterota bacterium]
MHLNIPHKFSREEALERVKKVLVDARPQLTGKATIEEERWESDILHFAFTTEGQHISGQLKVKDKEFELDAKLPLMLRMFEGKIEKMIAAQATQILG